MTRFLNPVSQDSYGEKRDLVRGAEGSGCQRLLIGSPLGFLGQVSGGDKTKLKDQACTAYLAS